ncbi:MAG TPA: peptidoglycan DD-metalloendopeptidase family protein [Alphaproteobacteria bacterium]|nr:peptidoglycan DD-metalloendopeptidase family protein [Alphaproteobacteria bacterium]
MMALLLALAALPAAAGTLSLEGKATQGGLLFGSVEPGARVMLDGKPVEVAADGGFVIGFGYEARPEAALVVRHPDGSEEERTLAVAQRRYEVQRINGLPEALVSPPAELLARIKAEQARIDKARASDFPEPLFRSGFVWPVEGKITGVFGSRRILNGQPRQPHFGVDIAGAVGTPVAAPADGIVTLAEPDLYLTGGTLIIDHGLELSSTFLHLSAIEVKLGDRVRQGQEVARMGASGRATGAHLHWGMNWRSARLDPALLVPPMAATLAKP